MDLDLIKMGDLLLYRKKGLFGEGIEKAQLAHGFPKEAAENTHVETSGGGPYAVYIGPPKSKVVDIRDFHKGDHVTVVRPILPEWKCKRYKTAFWAAANCNTRYDYSGIGGFLLKVFHQNESRWFCSENSLYAIQKEYPDFLGITPDKAMPAHFYNFEKFVFITEFDIPEK